jgi:hypothetical protein
MVSPSAMMNFPTPSFSLIRSTNSIIVLQSTNSMRAAFPFRPSPNQFGLMVVSPVAFSATGPIPHQNHFHQAHLLESPVTMLNTKEQFQTYHYHSSPPSPPLLRLLTTNPLLLAKTLPMSFNWIMDKQLSVIFLN